jgi:hypothetical protein
LAKNVRFLALLTGATAASERGNGGKVSHPDRPILIPYRATAKRPGGSSQDSTRRVMAKSDAEMMAQGIILRTKRSLARRRMAFFHR